MEKMKMATKKVTTIDEPAPIVVKIVRVPYNQATLHIVGTRPLLVDRMPYIPIDGKLPKMSEEQKYQASFYWIPPENGDEPRQGFPGKSIKSACINAARFIPGLHMTTVRGLFFVDEGREGLLEIKCPGGKILTPVKDCQMVHKHDGTSIASVRVRYDEWGFNFNVRWQPTMTNLDAIMSLVDIAGENIGLGCRRPEKSGQQEYGTFKLIDTPVEQYSGA
jgi:hypothetical protein